MELKEQLRVEIVDMSYDGFQYQCVVSSEGRSKITKITTLKVIHVHSLDEVPATPATCTEDGNKEQNIAPQKHKTPHEACFFSNHRENKILQVPLEAHPQFPVQSVFLILICHTG